MKTMLSRFRMRDLALFVIVAILVAVVVVFVGRELGVGEQAVAVPEAGATTASEAARAEVSGGQQADVGQSTASTDLMLTLTAAEICEVVPDRGPTSDTHWSQNEDGTYSLSDLIAWGYVAETPVQWSVSGGRPPYTLEIDGESRDAAHERTGYRGASGTASVSCALEPGETVIGGPYNDRYRRYLSEPRIDSGLKTIWATVTDAAGATAEASVGVYAILDASDSDTQLTAGETYRIAGIQVTIPAGANAVTGSYEISGGGSETIFEVLIESDGYRAWVGIGRDTGHVYGRRVERLAPSDVQGATAAEAALNAQLDVLIGSIGNAPTPESD